MAHWLLELGDTPSIRVGALLHFARVERRRGDNACVVRAISPPVTAAGPPGRAWSVMRDAAGSGVTAADYERSLRRHVLSFPESRTLSSEVYLELARVQARELNAPNNAITTLVDAIAKQPGSLTLRTQYASLLRETGAWEACVKE